MQVQYNSLNVDHMLYSYVLPVTHIALHVEPYSYCSTVFTCYVLEYILKFFNNLENDIKAKYITYFFNKLVHDK